MTLILVILSSINALVFLAMAWLGVLLTTQPIPVNKLKRYKWIFSILTLIGVCSIILLGIVSYKINQEAQVTQKDLSTKMDKISTQLAPFESLAKELYPSLPSSDALQKLKDNLSQLQSRTSILEQETQKTVFQISNQSQKKLDDGTFETKFTLIPKGKNVIPILRIIIQPENNASIIKFDVEGKTIPGMSFDRIAENKTAWSKEFRSIYPGIVYVKVITDKSPGHGRISIDPLED